MIGADGEVLYVGKAQLVKKRVAELHHARAAMSIRIARMIAQTAVDGLRHHRDRGRGAAARSQSHQAAEAALTTCCCATTNRFPYILIARRPRRRRRLIKHRGARSTRKGDYFGPFASAGAVNRTLNALQRAFLLRSCSDSYYENRTRPCLLYQIKRCSGALHRRDRARRLRRAGRRGARFSLRQEPRACATGSPRR